MKFELDVLKFEADVIVTSGGTVCSDPFALPGAVHNG